MHPALKKLKEKYAIAASLGGDKEMLSLVDELDRELSVAQLQTNARMKQGLIEAATLFESLDRALASPERIAADEKVVGGFVSSLNLVETAEEIVTRTLDALGTLAFFTGLYEGRFENFARDLAEHGIRFDLMPTTILSPGGLPVGGTYTVEQVMNFSNRVHGFYHEYLRRIDDSIRERARDALFVGERPVQMAVAVSSLLPEQEA